MDIRKFVMDVCAIQKQYADLYEELDELISINPDYIQVNVSVIAELLSLYPTLEPSIERCDSEEYPLEVKMQVNGVTFLSIGTFESFRKYGFLKE